MRYHDITEAPLASYGLMGDWSDDRTHFDATIDSTGLQVGKNSFLSRYDRRLAQTPRVQERVATLLLNFPHPIHLVLWNSPSALHFLDIDLDLGEITAQDIRRFPNQLRKQIKALPENAIGIVLTHNDGGTQRHPLTPWMIIHRMVHALITNDLSTLSKWMRVLGEGVPKVYSTKAKRSGRRAAAKEWIRNIATFKAARDDNVIDSGDEWIEGFCEMMVQYIVMGKIPLNEPPQTFTSREDDHALGCMWTLHDPQGADSLRSLFKQQAEAHFEEVLSKAVGKFFAC